MGCFFNSTFYIRRDYIYFLNLKFVLIMYDNMKNRNLNINIYLKEFQNFFVNASKNLSECHIHKT